MFPDIDASPVLAGTIPFGQAVAGNWYIMHGDQYVCRLHGDYVLRYWHNGDRWCTAVDTCYNKMLPLQPVKMTFTFMAAPPITPDTIGLVPQSIRRVSPAEAK